MHCNYEVYLLFQQNYACFIQLQCYYIYSFDYIYQLKSSMQEIKIIIFVILTIITYLKAKSMRIEPTQPTKTITNKGKDRELVVVEQKKEATKIEEFKVEEILKMDSQIFSQFDQKRSGINKDRKRQSNKIKSENGFEKPKFSIGKTMGMEQSIMIYDASYFQKNPFEKQQQVFNFFQQAHHEKYIPTNSDHLSSIQHLFPSFQEQKCAEKAGLNHSMSIQTNNTSTSSFTQMIDESNSNLMLQEQSQEDEKIQKNVNTIKKKSIKKKQSHLKSNQDFKKKTSKTNHYKQTLSHHKRQYNNSTPHENLLDLQQQISRRQLELMILRNIQKSRLGPSQQ